VVGNRTAKEHATASGSVKTLYTYNSWDQLVTEGVDDNDNDTLADPSEVDRRYTYDDNGSTTSVTSGPPGNQTCPFGQPHLQSASVTRQHAAIANKEMSDGQGTAAGLGAGSPVAADLGEARQERPERAGVLPARRVAGVGVVRLEANHPTA
jgi:hypothetical protein